MNINKIGQYFWYQFDIIDEKSRFIWFLSFIAIPFSILIGIDSLLGLGFAILMILWRNVSNYQLKKIKEKNKNGEK